MGAGTLTRKTIHHTSMHIRFWTISKGQDPLTALDFLNRTGQFSVLYITFTMSYFKRWQRFAYLVQEDDLLASAFKDGQSTGECGEALKALSGEVQSKFFEGTEVRPTAEGAAHRKIRSTWVHPLKY